MAEPTDRWSREAACVLRSELARHGVRRAELVKLLARNGGPISLEAVNSKLSRGTFSAAFMLRVLDAIAQAGTAARLPPALSPVNAKRPSRSGRQLQREP